MLMETSVLTNGDAEEDCNGDVSAVRVTKRRHCYWDGGDQEANIVDEKGVDLGEICEVAARYTADSVGNSDYRQQKRGAAAINSLQ